MRGASVVAGTLLIVAGAVAQQPAQLKPQTKQAPGAAANKVWVNTTTNVYHCPGAVYYGKTKEGKYVTESEAKKEGDKPSRGDTCFGK